MSAHRHKRWRTRSSSDRLSAANPSPGPSAIVGIAVHDRTRKSPIAGRRKLRAGPSRCLCSAVGAGLVGSGDGALGSGREHASAPTAAGARIRGKRSVRPRTPGARKESSGIALRQRDGAAGSHQTQSGARRGARGRHWSGELSHATARDGCVSGKGAVSSRRRVARSAVDRGLREQMLARGDTRAEADRCTGPVERQLGSRDRGAHLELVQ
jgi:hypothetical protein